MTPLNYNHLYYFYLVSLEGSISAASDKLHLTPQTLSGQISKFEDSLGVKLFDRQGRKMVISAAGQSILEHAEQIFEKGNEIQAILKHGQNIQSEKFIVGITDVVPKALALRLLRNVIDQQENVQLICHEGDQESLLADLAVNKLDCVLTDQALLPNAQIKAYNHLVAVSGMTFFTTAKKANKLKKDFPHSLDQQNFLMPGKYSLAGGLLTSWFKRHEIQPRVVAEFDDSALMQAFGTEGYGVFAAPTLIEEDVLQQHKVKVIGRIEEAIERYYIISTERNIKNTSTANILSAIS